MRGVYLRDNSPYYWLRYYDKFDEKHKRKSINTKIEVTEADRKRREKSKKLVGTQKLRDTVSAFQSGLAQRNIEMQSGVKLRFEMLLSEGYAEFKKVRSVPDSKDELKQKTLINYDIAVNHMISACGDKKIYKYTPERDYVDLLHYLDKIRIPRKKENPESGENEIVQEKMSVNSKSIYTRSLRALWNYFCDKNYAAKNIIEPVEPEEVDPDPIPLEEMYSIMKYFESDKNNPHHYHLINFLLLTGCRPSSAMVQLKEDIDLKRKVIKIKNVKTGKTKGKNYYLFPIYKELGNLLISAGVTQGDTGRLFHQFKLNELNYTYPLSFWERAMKVLKIAKHVRDYYTLKQIRSTTASFMVNVLGMKVYTVKKLLDHTDMKITDKHYLRLNLKNVREEMDDFSIDDFIEEVNRFE